MKAVLAMADLHYADTPEYVAGAAGVSRSQRDHSIYPAAADSGPPPRRRLLLTVEHRSAPAPEPVLLRLTGGGQQPLTLRLDGAPPLHCR